MTEQIIPASDTELMTFSRYPKFLSVNELGALYARIEADRAIKMDALKIARMALSVLSEPDYVRPVACMGLAEFIAKASK